MVDHAFLGELGVIEADFFEPDKLSYFLQFAAAVSHAVVAFLRMIGQ